MHFWNTFKLNLKKDDALDKLFVAQIQIFKDPIKLKFLKAN